MKYLAPFLVILLFVFQDAEPTEFDPVETYNFIIVLLGILLLIIILAYILLTSRQE